MGEAVGGPGGGGSHFHFFIEFFNSFYFLFLRSFGVLVLLSFAVKWGTRSLSKITFISLGPIYATALCSRELRT